jgi:TolA-binding protein
MHSVQRYMLIGPVLLLAVALVVFFVKRHERQPQNAEAQLYYARTMEQRLAGEPRATAQDWEDCIAQYERVFKKWPESTQVIEAYAHIGTICKRQLKDRKRAMQWYGRLIEEFPQSEAAEALRREFLSLAMSFADTDEGRRQALAAYTDYIEHNPDADELDAILFKRGELCYTLGEAEAAISDFQRIIDEFPKSGRADDAVYYIGRVEQTLLGDEAKALEQYDKLIKDFPSSNQIAVAHKYRDQLWEARADRMLDEYFKGRYGLEQAPMYFVPPTPLYRVESSQDEERVKAVTEQTLDLVSAQIEVAITPPELVVTGSLVIVNPSEIKAEAETPAASEGDEQDKAEGEKKEEKKVPTEAKELWLSLNERMELQSLTRGEAELKFERFRNLVKVTLDEPLAVGAEMEIGFKVSNQGKEAPGIVVGEQYGHAFPHAFWFPITRLDDAFTSGLHVRRESEDVVSNGVEFMPGEKGLVVCNCESPTQGRFLMYGFQPLEISAWGEREVLLFSAENTDRAAVRAFLEEAVKAADYLVGVFGGYPYDKLVFAQSPNVKDTVFEHGAGLILINSSVPLASIKPEQICNELVQQWYGCLVYPQIDKWLWYTAGVASYYETLYLAHRYDAATMEAHLGELRDLYAKIFEHLGERTMAYRDVQKKESERVFDGLIYTKGAYAMHTFRWIAGDEHFVEAQRAFLKKFAFRPVTIKDLREAFEKETGQELYDVFYEWLIQPGTPSFKVEGWTSTPAGDQFKVAFKLTQPASAKYVLPVEVAFESGEQRVVIPARITKTQEEHDGKKEDVWHEEFAFMLPFDPERIVLDPNNRFLLDPKSRRVWTRKDLTTGGTESTESSN